MKFRVQIAVIILMLFLPVVTRAENIVSTSSDSVIVDVLRQQGVNFTNNNELVLLKSGREKFEDLKKALRQAKHSIHMEYFNFRNDTLAFAIFDIMAEKAKEGVEVRALFDSFGNSSNNRPLKNKHLRELRSRGIQIYEYDPIKFPFINHVFCRDHRKIVVIDGKVAYTGGMNIAEYYITGTEVVGEWRDTHCRIEGSAVDDLQKIFIRTWNKVTGENLHGSQYYYGCYKADYFKNLKPDTSATAGHKMLGIVNRVPHTTNKIMRQFYLGAINAAKDSIKIINPYITFTPALRKALANAVKRGVKVEILVGATSDIPLTPDAMYYILHKLMKKGCTIWLYEKGFHHSKIMAVDGKFCTVGSCNLDTRSLKWDLEENVAIIDSCVTHEMERDFIADKQHSFLMTPESWDKFRTPWKKFVGWFGHLLIPFV